LCEIILEISDNEKGESVIKISPSLWRIGSAMRTAGVKVGVLEDPRVLKAVGKLRQILENNSIFPDKEMYPLPRSQREYLVINGPVADVIVDIPRRIGKNEAFVALVYRILSKNPAQADQAVDAISQTLNLIKEKGFSPRQVIPYWLLLLRYAESPDAWKSTADLIGLPQKTAGKLADYFEEVAQNKDQHPDVNFISFPQWLINREEVGPHRRPGWLRSRFDVFCSLITSRFASWFDDE
jgi:hypothetical protein